MKRRRTTHTSHGFKSSEWNEARTLKIGEERNKKLKETRVWREWASDKIQLEKGFKVAETSKTCVILTTIVGGLVLIEPENNFAARYKLRAENGVSEVITETIQVVSIKLQ